MRREILLWMLGLVLAAIVGYGYFQQRNIKGRYLEFRENEKQLEAVRREIEALEMRVDQARQRVENMEKDPVEMEAAIRRIRRLTRDGEVVFRIEEQPVQGDAPTVTTITPPSGEPAPPATPEEE